MRIQFTYLAICFFVLMSSCSTIQLPKYTTVDDILQIKTGMIREQAESILGAKIYDLKSIEENGNYVVIYKYRLTDRIVNRNKIDPSNGINTWGKFHDLQITYSKDGRVISAITN